MLPFVIIQCLAGVKFGNYLLSFVNVAATYVFAQAVYTFSLTCQDKEKLFRRILNLNFAFCLIAIPFYFTKWYAIFWISQAFTQGVTNFLRFRLFTYEASYYAVLLSPIALFYFWQLMLRQNTIKSWKLIVLLVFPYIISLSIGVIFGLLLAIGGTYLIYWRTLSRRRRVILLLATSCILSVTGTLCLILFFPHNALVVRMSNIFGGHDISSQGRTTDAFRLSERILELRNPWVGIGPGQLKTLGGEIIRSYYNYDPRNNDNIAIPNAMAETLLIFGWIGLLIRVIAQAALFFYAKPWKNYFQLSMFLFIFIYQFTGSYITNVAEYVIWVFAFTNNFPQFDIILPSTAGPKPKIPSINASLQNL